MYRADWGQSVRTEHHLAPPNGSRGGASNGLDLDQIFTLILPPSGESLPISFSQCRAATRWVIS